MVEPKNNQEFYQSLDTFCARLRDAGMDTEANRISHRLHDVPWNSTSELFDELEKVINGVLSSPNAAMLTVPLRNELNIYIQLLANV